VDHELNAIAGKDLQGCVMCRLRKGMGIHTHEERSRNAGCLTIFSDSLTDRQDVILIKAASERRAAVPGCAKNHRLGWVLRVRMQGVIGRNKAWDIDQNLQWSRFTG
jgi:hypothetical protein